MNLSVKTHVFTDKTLIFYLFVRKKAPFCGHFLYSPSVPQTGEAVLRTSYLTSLPCPCCGRRLTRPIKSFDSARYKKKRADGRFFYNLSIIRLKRAVIRPAAALPAMSTSSPSFRVVDSFAVLQMFVTTDIPNTRISL